MRMFTGLPFSLIFTTLVALVATAVPVGADDAKEPLFVLGKDNFDEVTAKGVWSASCSSYISILLVEESITLTTPYTGSAQVRRALFTVLWSLQILRADMA
jgi:hypothetical protein